MADGWEIIGPAADDMPSAMAAEQQRREQPLIGGPPGQPAATGGTFKAPAPTGIAASRDGRPGGAADAVPGWVTSFSDQVFKAEGTAGQPWQYYGGHEFKPGAEHPGAAAKRTGPTGKETHAAGPGQWQEGTYNETKPLFRERFGRDPVFSSMDDQRWMVALRAGSRYPGGLDKLQKDAEAGQVDTSKLGDWDGFKSKSGWGIASAGQWKVNPEAVAREQSRRDTRTVWMAPDEYLSLFPESKSGEKRKSLMRSLGLDNPIEEIPSLDVTRDGNRFKVIDQDGAHRARVAKENGVDLIPVAVHGAGGGAADWIEGINGNTRRFNFQDVPAAARRAERGFFDAPGPDRGPGMLSPERVLGGLAGKLERWADRTGGGVVEGARRGFGDAPIGQGTEIGRGLSSAGTPGEADPGLAARAAGTAVDVVGRGLAGAVGGVLGGVAEGYRGSPLPQEIPAINGGGAPVNIPDTIQAAPELAPSIMPVPGLAPFGMSQIPFHVPPATRSPEGAPLPGQVGPSIPNNMQRTIRDSTRDLNRAVELINKRAAEAEKAQPGQQAAAVAKLEAGRAEGEPIQPFDVVGQPVLGLAGTAARKPGPGQEIARRFVEGRRATVSRESPIGAALKRGIDRLLGTENARAEAKHLADARSGAENRRLWKEAEDAVHGLPRVSYETARDYAAAGKELEEANQAVAAAEAKLEQMNANASRQHRQLPPEPERLTTFLISKGGLADDTFSKHVHRASGHYAGRNNPTDVRQILDGAKGFRGLLRPRLGIRLDEAAEAAFERGFIEEYDNNLLLDALAQDVAGHRVYSARDQDLLTDHRDAVAHNAALDEELAKRPVGDRPKVTEKQLQAQRDELAQSQARVQAAREVHNELKEFIEAGQADGTLNLPGAVTSPVLRRLQKSSWVQKGLSRGAKLEREESIATGRRFHAQDYAVLGEDAEGNPIVGAVPTMKLWMKAKEGLDAMIADERAKGLYGRMTPEGRIMIMLRDQILKEVDRINPAYKPARDHWAGFSVMLKALEDGKDMPKWDVELITERMRGATESEKKNLRIGYADTWRKAIDEKQLAGDPTKSILNSTADRERLEAVAGGPEAAKKMVEKIERAREQFERSQKLTGGSITAERLAEDSAATEKVEDAVRLARGLASVGTGHASGLLDLMRSGKNWAAEKREGINADSLANVMRLLTGEGQFAGLKLNPTGDLISSFPLPKTQNAMSRLGGQAARSRAANAMMGILRDGSGLARAYNPRDLGIPPRGSMRPPPF